MRPSPAQSPSRALVAVLVLLVGVVLVVAGSPALAVPPGAVGGTVGPVGAGAPLQSGTEPLPPEPTAPDPTATDPTAPDPTAPEPAPTEEPAPADDPALPLLVTLTSVSPSTLPPPGSGGQVTVSGRVLNTSESTYERVNVYPVLGTEPMTTSQQLRTAAALPDSVVIGERNLDPANFDSLGDVPAGGTLSFTVQVGADDVGLSSSGVYWLGAQALGEADGERDVVADGRARTFVSLRTDDPDTDPRGPRTTARQVEVSLVLPLREPVRRDSAGRLSDAESWESLLDPLSPGGRLGRIVALGSTSGLTPSWLVDPAVVDAAVSSAQGDPGFPLTAQEAADAAAADLAAGVRLPGAEDQSSAGDGGSTGDGGLTDDDADQEPEVAPSASPDPTTSPAPGDDTSAPSGPLTAEATFVRPGSPAAAWLRALGAAIPSPPDRLDLLPYGDPDVSAIARDQRRSLLRDATAATARATQRLGLDGRLLVAPPRGFLRPDVVAPDGPLDPSVPLLLSPRALQPSADASGISEGGTSDGGSDAAAEDEEESAARPGSLRTRAGHPVVVFDRGVLRGGPSAGPDQSALGVRQRVLAEALVALLNGTQTPGSPRSSLVAMPPPRWDPGPDWAEADLLGGLQVPWITSESLPGAQLVVPGSDPGGSDLDELDAPTDDAPTEPAVTPSPAGDDPTAGSDDPSLTDVLDAALAAEPSEEVSLRYPRRQARRELSVALLATADDQVDLSRALGSVLVASPDTGRQLVRAALTGASWHVRGRESRAAQRLAGQAVTALQVLRQIRLEVPSLVTMSSSSGTITVKIVNGLDQPVRVGLDADVSSGLTLGSLVLDVPDALDIPANQQVTLRLQARAGAVGVNVVDLRAAAPTGRAVGLPSQVNVRASTLGVQIYRIMGAAGLVILALVIFRIRRRIRVRRATHGPLLAQESA